MYVQPTAPLISYRLTHKMYINIQVRIKFSRVVVKGGGGDVNILTVGKPLNAKQ